MPTVLQASMSSVPAGAVSFLPSTVRVTSAIFVAPASRRLLRGRPALASHQQSETCGHSPAHRAGETPALRVHRNLVHHALFFERARLAFQMIFEFFSELLHEADRWHRGRVAERTEGSSEHVFR